MAFLFFSPLLSAKAHSPGLLLADDFPQSAFQIPAPQRVHSSPPSPSPRGRGGPCGGLLVEDMVHTWQTAAHFHRVTGSAIPVRT